jgi:fumarate hydratase, class II
VSVQSDNPTPTYVDRPIGIDGTGTRTEFDSLGTVEVPADRYWGAQTQRSLQHFSIGNIVKPINMIGDGLAGA